jgi:TP901 family phage tail tape measure protein
MATIGLKATFTATDRVTATVLRMQSAVIGFTKSAGAGLAKLDALNSKIASGVKTAGLALGAAGFGVGLIAKNVIGAGADFEQAITNVGAVSLMTRDQIADLEKEALRLGATTKFSATEVANAMEMMGKAGFTNAETLSGVGGILAAAAAEGAGLEETASNVSNVLKGMGLATSESGRVADVLTLASSRTNSSISSLGESMKNVSSTARTFGVSLEDTVAAVALLQDVGLDASEAGSSLNTMLTMMAAPSAAVQAQMKKLGVSFKDSKGNMLPFTDVLGQLSKSAKKSGGNMEQVAFLADLVGLRGAKAAGNLKSLFDEGKVEELAKELMGAKGSAEKMAGIRMDTLLGDWEQLGGAVDSFKIKLFNMESGPLRDIVKRVTEWVDANGDLVASGVVEFIEKAIPILDNFADGVKSAFQDTAPVVKGLAKTLGKLFGADGDNARMSAFLWGEAIAKWTIRWVAFSAAVKVARVGMFLFGNVTKIVKGITLAYQFVVGTCRAALLAFQVATQVGAASTVAMSTAMTGATASAGTMMAATNAASMSFGRMALAAGAAMAAVAALYAAYDQNESLKKETGGKGIFDVATDLASGMSLKESADEYLDQQARQRRREQDAKEAEAARIARTPEQQAAYDRGGAFLDNFGTAPAATPAAIPPGRQGPTAEELKAAVAQELTVKLVAEPGTTAEVVKKPAGAKVALQPSGGWFD